MSRHLTLLTVALTLTLAGTAQAQNEASPDTKDRGRAAIEFEDDEIHLVAAYYYSQRNHDSRWLLIEAAVSTEDRMTIHRDSIRLVTPDGVEVTLAGQKPFSQDIQRIRLVMQNASTTRHGILSYFKRRGQNEESGSSSSPVDRSSMTTSSSTTSGSPGVICSSSRRPGPGRTAPTPSSSSMKACAPQYQSNWSETMRMPPPALSGGGPSRRRVAPPVFRRGGQTLHAASLPALDIS